MDLVWTLSQLAVENYCTSSRCHSCWMPTFTHEVVGVFNQVSFLNKPKFPTQPSNTIVNLEPVSHTRGACFPLLPTWFGWDFATEAHSFPWLVLCVCIVSSVRLSVRALRASVGFDDHDASASYLAAPSASSTA